MSYCDRCVDNIKCVTPRYVALTDSPISKNGKTRLRINTDSAKARIIQTCNKHTSPKSREILHQDNVFKRYEHQFLNLLLKNVSEYGYTIHLNEVNKGIGSCTKETRYDALVFNRTRMNVSYAINIELDEQQHYNTSKQFEADRIKEKCFIQKYGNMLKKIYIFRVRVGENKSTSCVGKNNNNTCKVTNKARFDRNMILSRNHIANALQGASNNHHAYIDFSNDTGVSTYKYKQYTDITGRRAVKKDDNLCSIQ